MDEPAYTLDLSDLPSEEPSSGGSASRPWVGIHFRCCGAYARVYRNRERTAYEGRCPRCLREVRLRIGPDGVSARFFEAT